MTQENQSQATALSSLSPPPHNYCYTNYPDVRMNEYDYVRGETTVENQTAGYLKTVSRYSAHDYKKMVG